MSFRIYQQFFLSFKYSFIFDYYPKVYKSVSLYEILLQQFSFTMRKLRKFAYKLSRSIEFLNNFLPCIFSLNFPNYNLGEFNLNLLSTQAPVERKLPMHIK